MESTRIASTPLLGLKPLGSAGERSHGRITDLLRAQLGDEIAAVLAEPVPASDGHRIDWYVPGAVTAVPLSALDAAARSAAEARLVAIRDAVLGLAQQYEQGDTASDRALGTALRNAMTTPDESCVYVVAGAPVLIAWAYARENASERHDGLSAIVSRARAQRPAPTARPETPAPPMAPVIATARPAAAAAVAASGNPAWLPALLWLLFVLFLALIFWLLLTACALRLPLIGDIRPNFLNFCSARAESSGIVAEGDRTVALEAQLRQLELAALRRQGDCRQAAVPSAPSEMQRRLDEAGARGGEMQISLSWDGPADLDLMIACPTGQINFRSRRACDGELDVDMNAGTRRSMTPVENAVWAQSVPRGPYQIGVNLYDRRDDARRQIPFKVRIRRNGREETLEGAVNSEGVPQIVQRFEQ